MISAIHRFHGYSSLRRTYREGKTVRRPFFAVKYLLNERRRSYRLGVVVSRKVHKSAVGRNRLRRRIYTVVRQMEGDILKPYDIVITIFSDELLNLSPPKLEHEIRESMTDAGVLSKRIKRG